MATKTDPFEKFKSGALTGGLGTTISTAKPAEQKKQDYVPVPAPSAEKPKRGGKNDGCELISLHVNKEQKKSLDLLKAQTGRSLKDLFAEAIDDFLIKNGMR